MRRRVKHGGRSAWSRARSPRWPVSRDNRSRPATAVAWCAALGMLLSAAPACASDGDLAPSERRSYAAHIVVAANAYKAPSTASGVRLPLKTETRWSRGPMSLLVLDDRRDAKG